MATPSLKERAQRVLEALDPGGVKRQTFPKPIIVEFVGPPEAGKTTTIDAFIPGFHRLGFRVRRPQEGAQVYEHIPRTGPEYNVLTGTYQLGLVLTAVHDLGTDLLVLDRGIYDPYCWMEYWVRKGKLSVEKAREYQAFFADARWRSLVDACFFLVCDPEEALRRNRENTTTVLEEFGETTNPASITLLRDIALDAFHAFKERGAPAALIDTTRISQVQVADKLVEMTLDLAERRLGLASDGNESP